VSAEAALVAYLDADPDVARMAGPRIYPQSILQGGGLPAVTYYRTGQQTVKSLGGLSGTSWARVTLDCWAANYTDAKTLADAIRGTKTTPKLDGFRGTVGGVKILACFCTSVVDVRERPVHGDEVGVPHVAMDFDIIFEDV